MPKSEALQFEMIDRKSPEILAALREAPMYKKTGTVRARPAIPGEEVITILKDGRTETPNAAKDGDWIITNPKGERYINSGEKFFLRYDPGEEEGVYIAKGYIRAIRNPFGKPIEIMAQWGKPQYGNAECMIGDICDEQGVLDEEPYILDQSGFEEYVPVETTPPQ